MKMLHVMCTGWPNKNRLKNCRLLFSAVISEHFSENRMIISVLAAKIWYLKKCAVFIGLRCI